MPGSERLSQLESRKVALRALVFAGGPEGEAAVEELRRVRAEIERIEAPARRAADKRARAARADLEAYVAVAISEDAEKPRWEKEAHERVADLCGGTGRAFRLLRLLGEQRDVRVKKLIETDEEFEQRVRVAFAVRARDEGYSPEAVRALLAVQK